MTQIVQSPEAADDLEELVDFLLRSKPEFAIETVDLVLDALSVLERHPLIGRPIAHGLRELVISRAELSPWLKPGGSGGRLRGVRGLLH